MFPRDRIRERALTLIEVMVALGVLVILVSGIFLVVKTSLQTVIMIDDNASRQDELTNLADVLRLNFRNLHSQARMVAAPVKQADTEEFLFIIRNAPGFLTWLAEPEAEDMIVLLALRHDGPDNHWRVCLKRFAPPVNFPAQNFDAKSILRLGEKIPWLELVGDFQKLTPRFYDAKKQEWTDRWDQPKVRPALIELLMLTEVPKDMRSQTSVFWLPPIKLEEDQS